jgi:hypothetical protein
MRVAQCMTLRASGVDLLAVNAIRFSPREAQLDQFCLTYVAYGKAHLSPAQHAPNPEAWISYADVDSLGPRCAQPSSQEGSEAPHREASVQVRRRVTRACAFRGRGASHAAQTSGEFRKRGKSYEPGTSRSGRALPLSRFRGLASSCPVMGDQPSNATGSSADSGRSFVRTCYLRNMAWT